MPLISCPDCNREVSTKARQCVHCGRPWPSCARPCAMKPALVGLLIIAALAGGVAFVARARCKALKCRSEVRHEIKRTPAEVKTPAPAEEK